MRITVSNWYEAVKQAQKLFQVNPNLEFIIAEENVIMDGITFPSVGLLIMHRSGKIAMTTETWIEKTKQELIEGDA